MTTVHGTCLVVDGTGLLLRGPSGSGKSDLALRCLRLGARLVADDQVVVEASSDGCLLARPPAILAGRIEVRGIGILEIDHEPAARLDAVVDLVAREAVERLPEPRETVIMDAALPRFALHAFDVSAPEKVVLIAREAARHGR